MWARRGEVRNGKVRYASLPSAVSWRAFKAQPARNETADGKEAYRTFPWRISERRAHIGTRRRSSQCASWLARGERLRPAEGVLFAKPPVE